MSEQSYWNGNGKYQKKYDRLQKLIPESGHCEQDELELLRIFGNLYYGLMNNGDFSIDNGNYHDDFKHIKIDLPEEIENFKKNIHNLEDYYYQRGDYNIEDIEEMCNNDSECECDFDDPYFEKKINLGLDLQGGSYLLLQIMLVLLMLIQKMLWKEPISVLLKDSRLWRK